jgi:hypothetical protein
MGPGWLLQGCRAAWLGGAVASGTQRTGVTLNDGAGLRGGSRTPRSGWRASAGTSVLPRSTSSGCRCCSAA